MPKTKSSESSEQTAIKGFARWIEEYSHDTRSSPLILSKKERTEQQKESISCLTLCDQELVLRGPKK